MTHRNWKTTLKRVLSRAHVLPAVRSLHYHVHRVVDRDFRASELLREQEFREFSSGYGAAFRNLRPVEQGQSRRVLVVSSGSLGQLVEIALVKAFQAAGYHPVVLTDYDRWVDAFYREVGIQDLLYWDEFVRLLPDAEAVQVMANVSSFEQLLTVDYDGVRVGKYATSTALRHLRVGRLDLTTRQFAMRFCRFCNDR